MGLTEELNTNKTQIGNSCAKDEYIISATNRQTKKREPVTAPMSREDAEHWSARPKHKQTHKYFKIAKHPYYAK